MEKQTVEYEYRDLETVLCERYNKKGTNEKRATLSGRTAAGTLLQITIVSQDMVKVTFVERTVKGAKAAK